MTTDIVGFSACALVITLSGTRLSRHGSRLADLTGLSRAWIGLILMATVTSLPEMLTGLSSIVIVNTPDMAAGNVLGSCAFKSVYAAISSTHLISILGTIIMTAMVAIGLPHARKKRPGS